MQYLPACLQSLVVEVQFEETVEQRVQQLGEGDEVWARDLPASAECDSFRGCDESLLAMTGLCQLVGVFCEASRELRAATWAECRLRAAQRDGLRRADDAFCLPPHLQQHPGLGTQGSCKAQPVDGGAGGRQDTEVADSFIGCREGFLVPTEFRQFVRVVVEGHGEVLGVQGCVLVGQDAEVFQCFRADCQRLGVLVSEGEPVGEVVQCLRERQPVAFGIGFRQGPVAGDGLFCRFRGACGMPQRTKAQGVTVQCCGKFRPMAVSLLLYQLTLYCEGFGCCLFCVHPLPGVGELRRQGAQRGAESGQMGAVILLGQRPEAVHGFCRCRSGLRIAPHVFQPGGQ